MSRTPRIGDAYEHCDGGIVFVEMLSTFRDNGLVLISFRSAEDIENHDKPTTITLHDFHALVDRPGGNRVARYRKTTAKVTSRPVHETVTGDLDLAQKMCGALPSVKSALGELPRTIQMFAIILAIDALKGKATVTDLTRLLGLSWDHVSKLVTIGVGRGWIASSRSQGDHRIYLLSLTPRATRARRFLRSKPHVAVDDALDE